MNAFTTYRNVHLYLGQVVILIPISIKKNLLFLYVYTIKSPKMCAVVT